MMKINVFALTVGVIFLIAITTLVTTTTIQVQIAVAIKPRCVTQDSPNCHSLGYDHGFRDAIQNTSSGSCPSEHSKEFCGGYIQGFTEATSQTANIPKDSADSSSSNSDKIR
jgi:hypothetical protein